LKKKLADDIKKDHTSFYAYARSRSNVNASTGPILSDYGVLKTDPHEIAEELKAYFLSVFTKEDMQHLQQTTCSSTHSADLEDIHITEIVMMKLNKFREDKATGRCRRFISKAPL